jgi:hypothetical protein
MLRNTSLGTQCLPQAAIAMLDAFMNGSAVVGQPVRVTNPLPYNVGCNLSRHHMLPYIVSMQITVLVRSRLSSFDLDDGWAVTLKNPANVSHTVGMAEPWNATADEYEYRLQIPGSLLTQVMFSLKKHVLELPFNG